MLRGMSASKSVVVTFRVDRHLAEALDQLPDKSAFIRDALRRSFHATCPACGGEGRVDCEAADWLREVLERERARNCDCCGTAYPPASEASTGQVAEDDALCAHCGPEGHQH
jgi:hypothetical protein